MERRLKQDDVVITPSGARAQLCFDPDAEGFCTFRYLSGPEVGKMGECHEKLLVRRRGGQVDPPPVRLDAQGRRV